MKKIAITGRFQPFHSDHLDLCRRGLEIAEKVIVCITNPDARSRSPDETSAHRHLPSANPFHYHERSAMVEAALVEDGVPNGRFRITPFPLEEPSVWRAYVPPGTPQLIRIFSAWERKKADRLRQAGYPVVLLDGDSESRISATDIRASMASGGGSWNRWVPPGCERVLKNFGEETLRERCALPSRGASHVG